MPPNAPPQQRRTNAPRVLTPDQKQRIIEWFMSGLSPYGVQAHMEQFNREIAAQAAQGALNLPQPFPDLNITSVRYYQRKMRREIDQAINDEIAREQLIKRKGLRDRDERIKRIERAAERLEPHLGMANDHGRFTADEAYLKYMEQLYKETTPRTSGKGEGGFDPALLRGLSLEQIKALAAEWRGQGAGAGGS